MPKTAYPVRKCKACDTSFTPKRIGSRHKGIYCSRQCRGKENYKNAACPTCNKSFTFKPSDPHKHCSPACVKNTGSNNPNWKGGKKNIQCAVCQKSFSVLPSQEHLKTCSMKCSGKRKKELGTMSGSSNGNWKGGLRIGICLECGKEFKDRKAGVAKYCSQPCFIKNQFKDRKASRWSNGFGTKNKKVGKRADLGGQFFRSGWEANYARYLNWLIKQRQVREWKYEADTFEFHSIKKGTRFYTPDFKVFMPNGKIEYHEVKGYKHPKGETALKRMAKYYPEILIVLIDAPVYNSIKGKVGALIPGWE